MKKTPWNKPQNETNRKSPPSQKSGSKKQVIKRKLWPNVAAAWFLCFFHWKRIFSLEFFLKFNFKVLSLLGFKTLSSVFIVYCGIIVKWLAHQLGQFEFEYNFSAILCSLLCTTKHLKLKIKGVRPPHGTCSITHIEKDKKKENRKKPSQHLVEFEPTTSWDVCCYYWLVPTRQINYWTQVVAQNWQALLEALLKYCWMKVCVFEI